MIVVDKVSKFYGFHAAVRDLAFEIEEGECVGFLGLNGAGKSTTLRLLSCLLLPTSGRIKIRGFDVEDEAEEIRKLIGFLPDSPPVYPEMKVHSFLRFAGKLRRMDAAALERRLPDVFDRTGLHEVADQPIRTLSHGYQQRVGIAQAIVHQPTLLILDEPISGLDPVQIVEMRKLIRTLRGEHTILLSSHILGEIQKTCDRLLMLHEGRLVAQGSEDELVARMSGRISGAGTGPAIIEVEVRGPREAVAEALAVDGATVEIESERDGVLSARVQAPGDIRAALAKRVVEAELDLLTLRVAAVERGDALEAVFLGLRERDGAASTRRGASA